MNTDEMNRVMYIWSTPAVGHLNPTLCFTNQLLKRLDKMQIKKIIFYSGMPFRDLILNLPNNQGKDLIEFRDYELKKYWGHDDLLKILMDWDTRPGKIFRAFRLFENSVKVGAMHVFDKLADDIHKDKPCFVLYDQALFFGKLALSIYEKKYKCSKPLQGCYLTTFLWTKGIYPLWNDLSETGVLSGKNFSIAVQLKLFGFYSYDLFKYFYIFFKTLWSNYGLTVYDFLYKIDLPLTKLQLIDDNFNLVFVLPDIQPRVEKLKSKSVYFIGPGVDESLRLYVSSKINNMEKYVNTIDLFLEKNLSEEGTFLAKTQKIHSFVDSENMAIEKKRKLYKPIIYVCMGTVFNTENSDLFQVIVEACTFFTPSFAVIVSTGNEKVYSKYVNSSFNNESILFIPHTPQIEILKIAHIFISHAGINSVSEAINYGVPLICIPLYGDQPLVAHRVADELGISIRLDPDSNLTVIRVKDSINEIISNSTYHSRSKELSKISQEYPGHITAADLIVKYINKNNRKRSVEKKAMAWKRETKSSKKITWSFLLFYFLFNIVFLFDLFGLVII